MKIKELQEQIEKFSFTSKTQDPESETEKKCSKQSIEDSIKDLELKTQAESSYSSQLKKMIISNQESIVKLI
jgi:hypothetical protein